MSFSFFAAPQEFNGWHPKGQSLQGLSLASETEAVHAESAVLSGLGADSLEMKWLETPRL